MLNNIMKLFKVIVLQGLKSLFNCKQEVAHLFPETVCTTCVILLGCMQPQQLKSSTGASGPALHS